jgi:hypothetical protein
MIDIVSNALKTEIANFEVRIKSGQGDAMKLHEQLLKNLERRMQDIEARELAQWEAQSNPDPSQRMPAEIFKRLNEKLLKEKADVMEAMCNARKAMPQPQDYEEKLHRFHDALNALNDPNKTTEQKNRHLKDCIERIDYYRETPTRSKRKEGEKKGTTFNTAGGRWNAYPIDVDVKLKV